MGIHVNDVKQWLFKTNSRMQEEKAYLTALDQAIGDGDHGINMARGFQEVAIKLEKTAYTDIGSLLQDTGMVLLSKVGGASGPLFGTAFMKAAMVCKGKTEATTADLGAALQEAVNGIKLRGKAEVGSKTMLDVWEPVAQYVQEHAEQLSWSALNDLARLSMEKTKEMEAKKGRAAYLGPRSVGHLDPGSVSTYYLMEALCTTMNRSGEPA
ncbi:dihydroxyacetone kinase subunit DhaL [Brevibacillus migulae]|uniref:dihydroxyacetone kinase subunit DhaL n=1 Tax=Brevibacillus migulae TaxID=1644114 RepID=UPI0022A75A03|nr:dihydroxyacetone kinase subunit DhaL [Brevibacillus migulae]